jgi:hypothetical protein
MVISILNFTDACSKINRLERLFLISVIKGLMLHVKSN